MKKIILLTALITASFILFSCSGQNNNKIKNDLTELKLKGKVKTLKETKYIAVDKFGEIQKGDMVDEVPKYICSFNEIGKKTEESQYNSDGSLLISGRWIYKYDDKMNNIEINMYSSDGSLNDKNIYIYDDKGNKTEWNAYNSNGSLSFKWSYKYDDKGNLIESNNYSSKGSLIAKYIYKYDDKGNKIEENLYLPNNELMGKTTYVYDDKGNEIEKQDYKSDGSLGNKSIKKYDDKGNMIKWDEDITYKYNFDEAGNWIKQIEFKNSIPQTIREREIIYY